MTTRFDELLEEGYPTYVRKDQNNQVLETVRFLNYELCIIESKFKGIKPTLSEVHLCSKNILIFPSVYDRVTVNVMKIDGTDKTWQLDEIRSGTYGVVTIFEK